MSGIKKVVGCILLMWGIGTYAGFMGRECIGESVRIPCENHRWDVRGEALYLQVPSLLKNLGQYQNQDLAWGFGYQLAAQLHYLKGNALNLEWYHFRSDATLNLATPSMTSQVSPEANESLIINQARLTTKPEWDQVNIEFLKNILLGDSDDARLHAGFNYSRISNSGHSFLDGQSSFNQILSTYQNTEIRHATYNGFGLRTGINLVHTWSFGLQAYTKAAASILAGSLKSSTQWDDNINGIFYTGMTSINRHTMVPALDGQIGLSYRYTMTQGDLSLHLGWLWVNYFSALSRAENHFGIQGADFGLQWTGDFI